MSNDNFEDDDIPVLTDVIKSGQSEISTDKYASTDSPDEEIPNTDEDDAPPKLTEEDIGQLITSIAEKLMPEVEEYLDRRIHIELESFLNDNATNDDADSADTKN